MTPRSFTERAVTIAQLRIDGPDIYWVEDSPLRQGRSVLLRRDAFGQTMEVLPMLEGSRLVNVETAVHERGGRAYAVRDGQLVISDGTDNRVYAFRVSDRKRRLLPLTPMGDCRYGDFEIDLGRGLVYAVREDYRGLTEGEEPENTLVAIPLDGSAARDPRLIQTIFSGTDFVSSPSLSHDGDKLAWLTWNHPAMPWTQTQLHVGSLNEAGELTSDVVLVDHEEVCVYEPRWTLDGDLMHVDDSTGWANFYRTEGFTKRDGEPDDAWQTRLRTRALHPSQQAFSRPQWLLGSHTYDNIDNEHLVCTWAESGERHVGTIRLDNGLLEEWPVQWWPIGNVAADTGQVIYQGETSTEPPSIIQIIDRKAHVLRPSSDMGVDPAFISAAEHVEWENRDGTSGYGLLYMPMNQDFQAPSSELPPLLVWVNPVPTTAAKPGMDFAVQFWTSRGFAILKVNPRGSTGWGRDYRSSLDGKWGILDVADTIDATNYVVDSGRVDSERVAIRGRHLGGITVLRTLAQTDIFSAGVVISAAVDVRDLVHNSHKFEKTYANLLMGSTNLEDAVWEERNPLSLLDQLDEPILFLHGGRDPLAPVATVKEAYKRLDDYGEAVAIRIFPDEGHEFVNARNIRLAWETELSFYGEVWNLPVTPKIPVKVVNWD